MTTTTTVSRSRIGWRRPTGTYSDWALGSSKDGDGYLSVTIPSGYLKADTPYKWKVQIADIDPSINNFNGYNRVESDNYAFYTGSKGSGNFLNFVVFDRVQSYIDGGTTTLAAGVANLAPWDIATVDPNKFRVENETLCDPVLLYICARRGCLYYGSLTLYVPQVVERPGPIADTSSSGYKFFVSDGSSSSALYAQYVNPSGTKPQLTREQMTPRDNAYLKTLEPTLTWKSEGTAYKYRVMILDWNNRRQVYKSSDLDGLEAGQDMSVTVPAGILQPSSPYRWFVDTFDSGKYNRMRTEILSFETPSAPELYATFETGISTWDGTVWSLLTGDHPASMVASGSTLSLYADFAGYGLY